MTRQWQKENDDSYMALFINPHTNKKTKVRASRYLNSQNKLTYRFSICAGSNSYYSYSGCFYPIEPDSFEHFFELIEARYNENKLFI
jgi:hypothetical protein